MWGKFTTSHTSYLSCHMKFWSPMLTPNYEQVICSPPRLNARMIYGHPKTLFPRGIPLLHDSYKCMIFSIWQFPMLTLIFSGYTFILSHPKIPLYFSYTALYSPTIKMSLSHYEKIRLNPLIQALIALLLYCLAWVSFGLIFTPEEF